MAPALVDWQRLKLESSFGQDQTMRLSTYLNYL